VYESWSNVCLLTGFSELRTTLMFLSQELDFFSTALVVFSGFCLGLRMTVAQYASEMWRTWQNTTKPKRLVTIAEILFFVEENKYSSFRITTNILYSSAVPGTSRTSRPPRTSRPKGHGRCWTKGTCACTCTWLVDKVDKHLPKNALD